MVGTWGNKNFLLGKLAGCFTCILSVSQVWLFCCVQFLGGQVFSMDKVAFFVKVGVPFRKNSPGDASRARLTTVWHCIRTKTIHVRQCNIVPFHTVYRVRVVHQCTCTVHVHCVSCTQTNMHMCVPVQCTHVILATYVHVCVHVNSLYQGEGNKGTG